MKRRNVKIAAAWVTFSLLLAALAVIANYVLLPKQYNRYYALEQLLVDENGHYDVQVFGACHSYTSFQAKYFQDTYGVSAYVMGNPGEIVPATWLRMLQRFETDVPKVALVEVWGIYAYDTYTSQEEIFTSYLPANVETLPLSAEKLEVIRDFDSLDVLRENLPLYKYKDRIIDGDIRLADILYSFDAFLDGTSDYCEEEMTMRRENNGFCVMPLWHERSGYEPYLPIPDYYEKQADVADDDKLALEDDLLKYVDKIIDLCEEKGVTLIFYRAPYVSTANELRKTNWFADYCARRGVAFWDLEQEVAFDITTDFLDYHHLNETGALKATDHMAPAILEALGKN